MNERVSEARIGEVRPAAEKPEFSLVIPCFNEEAAIRLTVDQLSKELSGAPNYEIVVVDDGSFDDTPRILDELARENPELTVVYHSRNRGYGAALKTGIRRAKSELIVITDADGTYPNSRIPDLVAEAADNDMVVGARIGENVEYSKIRKVPKTALTVFCSWVAGQSIPDINSGLRVFRKSIVEKFINILPDGFSFTTTITLAMLTNYYSVKYVPVDYSKRLGKSKIRPIHDTLKFFQLIIRTGMYFAPLRIFLPIILLLMLLFFISLGFDLFVLGNLTDKTIVLLVFGLNTAMFALLADMIDKRSGR